MHAAVMAAFEPGALEGIEGRALWRLDSDKYVHRLYVVSPVEPDLTHIVEQAGWIGQRWESTSYDPFLDRLKVGQQWGFRLTANAVERQFVSGKRGPLVPQQGLKHQTNWLLSHRAADCGFAITQVPVGGGVEDGGNEMGDQMVPNLKITGRNELRFSRSSGKPAGPREKPQKGQAVTILQVQYEGVLEVTDSAKLRAALIQGIGRAKAYGCGLMTLRAGV